MWILRTVNLQKHTFLGLGVWGFVGGWMVLRSEPVQQLYCRTTYSMGDLSYFYCLLQQMIFLITQEQPTGSLEIVKQLIRKGCPWEIALFSASKAFRCSEPRRIQFIYMVSLWRCICMACISMCIYFGICLGMCMCTCVHMFV